MCSIKIPDVFSRKLKKLKKSYPNSSDHIDNIIKSLKRNPNQGDKYPGFGQNIVRKLRIGLPGYKISKRDGLRLLHLLVEEKKMVIPLIIYRKSAYGSEQEVKKEIKGALKEILSELNN